MHLRAVFSGIVITATLVCNDLAAPAVVIYGGPTYNSATKTGYKFGELPYAPGNTAGDGVGVGTVSKYYGSDNYTAVHAVRWDTSGTFIELANLGVDSEGYTGGWAYAVNGAGTAVGASSKYVQDSYRGERAVRWDPSGQVTELGVLGNAATFVDARAYAVNASGTAVGWSENGTTLNERAVRWDASGTTAAELGKLGTDSTGYSISKAYAVNDAGTTVGFAEKYPNPLNTSVGSRAVRWNAGGTAATELGNLGTDQLGTTAGAAYAINNAGTAVGEMAKYTGSSNRGSRAVRWDASGTAATELGNLGTSASGVTQSVAYDVNSAGTAVGYARKYVSGVLYNLYRAVRWASSGSAATELGDLDLSGVGRGFSQALDINDAGVAVGSAEKYDVGGTLVGTRAVAWGSDGVAIDLNTLVDPSSGWQNLTVAVGVSNTGWITGYGTFNPGGGLEPYTRMFLMQIPEPVGLSLLAVFATILPRHRIRVYTGDF